MADGAAFGDAMFLTEPSSRVVNAKRSSRRTSGYDDNSDNLSIQSQDDRSR